MHRRTVSTRCRASDTTCVWSRCGGRLTAALVVPPPPMPSCRLPADQHQLPLPSLPDSTANAYAVDSRSLSRQASRRCSCLAVSLDKGRATTAMYATPKRSAHAHELGRLRPTCGFVPAPSRPTCRCAASISNAVAVLCRGRLSGCLAVLATDEDGHQVGAVRPELLQHLVGQGGGHQHRLPPARRPPAYSTRPRFSGCLYLC